MSSLVSPCSSCESNCFYACFCHDKALYDMMVRKNTKEEKVDGLDCDSSMRGSSYTGVEVSEVNR